MNPADQLGSYTIGQVVVYDGPTITGIVEIVAGDRGVVNGFIPNQSGGNDLEVSMNKGVSVTRPAKMWKDVPAYEAAEKSRTHLWIGAGLLAALVGAFFYFSKAPAPMRPVRRYSR